MAETPESDSDQQYSHRHTDTDITRRMFMQAGSISAVTVGLMGSAGTARAAPIRRTHTGADSLDGNLDGLLQRNQHWTDALPAGYFSDVQESQAPAVTSVCCSDSRVSQEGMFLAFLEPGFLFMPSNIRNKVISIVDGERVVDIVFRYRIPFDGSVTSHRTLLSVITEQA
jgi:carbonic anhydrase